MGPKPNQTRQNKNTGTKRRLIQDDQEEQEDQLSSFTNEISDALEGLAGEKSNSTVLAYRQPLAHWQIYCDGKRSVRNAAVGHYIYTVGPPETVYDFFENFVMRRTYQKHVPLNADVMTQVSLRNDENEGPSTSLTELTESAPLNKSGKAKIIEIPIGIESVKQYKKALMFLHEFQVKKRSIEWISPKKDQELNKLIKKYEKNLEFDQALTNIDRAAHCVIRDSYKPGELIMILKKIWLGDSRTSFRDAFCISARHHMLLRSQDLLNLNFADCFTTVLSKKQHHGNQQAVAFVFSIDKGKTIKDGEVNLACAIRHENIHRCPVSLFAFYLFDMFKDGAPFLNEERWQNWKIVPARNDPEKSLSSTQQYNATKTIFDDNHIFTSRVTHGGRHSGAIEAESLGVPFDIIKRGGNWKDRLGRLETHYLGKLPSQFARGIAGFWTSPFRLARNSVDPPLDLQRQIFPWIEDHFGFDNEAWKDFCNKEMQEFDENEDDGDSDILDDPEIEIIQEAEITQKRRKGKQPASRTVYRSVEAAKRGFLKLLLRCRRIILQDAAVLLYENRQNKLVNFNNTRDRFNVFATQSFKQLQREIISVLESPSVDRLQQYEHFMPAVVDNQMEVINRISDGQRSNDRGHQKTQEQVEKLQNVLYSQGGSQANQLQQLLYSHQALERNQQLLSAQIQLLIAANAVQQHQQQQQFPVPDSTVGGTLSSGTSLAAPFLISSSPVSSRAIIPAIVPHNPITPPPQSVASSTIASRPVAPFSSPSPAPQPTRSRTSRKKTVKFVTYDPKK